MNTCPFIITWIFFADTAQHTSLFCASRTSLFSSSRLRLIRSRLLFSIIGLDHWKKAKDQYNLTFNLQNYHTTLMRADLHCTSTVNFKFSRTFWQHEFKELPRKKKEPHRLNNGGRKHFKNPEKKTARIPCGFPNHVPFLTLWIPAPSLF